jgi:hypothetical protein
LTNLNPFDIIESTKEQKQKGDNNMTIKEFYNWAVKNGVEDFEIRLIKDEDGNYQYPDADDINIDAKWNEVVL